MRTLVGRALEKNRVWLSTIQPGFPLKGCSCLFDPILIQEHFIVPKNTKQTSSTVATLASEVLRSGSSSAIQKELAGSAMSQASTGKQTSAEMETKASRVLESDKYNATTKALAGSVLSQSNKERGN